MRDGRLHWASLFTCFKSTLDSNPSGPSLINLKDESLLLTAVHKTVQPSMPSIVYDSPASNLLPFSTSSCLAPETIHCVCLPLNVSPLLRLGFFIDYIQLCTLEGQQNCIILEFQGATLFILAPAEGSVVRTQWLASLARPTFNLLLNNLSLFL